MVGAMMDDPKVILRNIEHYQHLLTLYSTEYTRDQVLRLLGDAQECLPNAAAQKLVSRL